MAYTQADIDALKAAMATGTRRVTYGDKTVEYRDQADMERQLQAMQAEVNPSQAGSAVSYGWYSRD
jgi:hypothetical protein